MMITSSWTPILLFSWGIDGTIVLLYLAITLAAGLMMRKYVRSVGDFLVAGRGVDLHLGIASLAATEFGIVTCMANAELGYKYGFAGITPGIALALAMFVVGSTGFCIKPLRDRGVITLPEFFEEKFGAKVRWASGLVIVLGGLLNMGVFLRMGGDFLTQLLGLDAGYLEAMMTIILVIVAIYSILGGMLSVLVTDYLQFIVMSIGLVSVSVLFMSTFGWGDLTDHLMAVRGEAAFNPFRSGAYGWDRILMDVLIAFATILTWQTMITRVLAAKDSLTGQKIYRSTAPFFLVRFGIPALLGIMALYFFAGSGTAPDREILALPTFLAQAVPIGLLGLLIAGMLAADMSTNSSYMLAWSSVIYNDLLQPLHQNKWSEKKGLIINRLLMVGIGIFLLLYGLWYPLQGDLWVYLQVTGTIYLASMSIILISACYWPRANKYGAMSAIIVGSIVPILYLVLQQIGSTADLAAGIGPYQSSILAFLLTALAMYFGSIFGETKKG